ncbi:hypothetical protein BH23PSE2_BH23PSE2_13700 [soil metagenome]
MPSDIAGDAHLAWLARAYLDADYRWELEGHWHDLNIGLPAPGLELVHPEAVSFGFISAWNPYSRERPEADNRAADHALHQALIESGRPFRAAFASAPNRSWREPIWVVMGLALAEFDSLMRRFGQLGTLWWLPDEPVRLRMDASRPADITDDEHVDWLQASTDHKP